MSRIRFHVLSDLHLEYYNKLPQLFFNNKRFKPTINLTSKNVLCLCGDIGNLSTMKKHNVYEQFLSFASLNFDHVFLIAGNHEYYNFNKKNYNIDEINYMIQILCNKFNNVSFLTNQNKPIIYNDYHILGCTLWTDLHTNNTNNTNNNLGYTNTYTQNTSTSQSITDKYSPVYS